MLKKYRVYLILIGIVLLGFFLRVYKVTLIPPSLSWDEVSIGYNAFSILKTGKDEHGRLFPLDTFVAYGDYKPPLSIYATVPAVFLFGLNEFSVRLPSVLFGTFTVLVTFFLVTELFNRTRESLPTAYLSALLLAISPWHIQLSRAGFEANTAVFFIVLGVYLTLYSRINSKALLYCWLPFIAAVYTFNSARYFVPIFALALIWYSRKNFIWNKNFYLGILVASIFLLPIVPHLLSPAARLRFAEVNIFTDSSIVIASNIRRLQDGNTWWSNLLHNRRLGYARSYLIHFFDNLEPWFLFIRGDGNPKFSLQDVGELYLIEAPLLILGVYFLFSFDKRLAWLLIWWIIAAILPAATARETPHALRIENSLPVWQIFIAYGILSWFKTFKHNQKKIFLFGLFLLYSGSFLYFLHNYFKHYPSEFSGEWQYGYREALNFIQPLKKDYQSIVMTESIGRPYMYVAFYGKLDPIKLWNTKRSAFDVYGFYNVSGLGEYSFVRESPTLYEKNTLYILQPQFIPTNARILKRIYNLEGREVLDIFTV